MLEPSLALYGETFDKVDALLQELLSKSHARYALIIDLKGFVLVHQKALWAPKPPSLDSLATLIASNYSANLAIAKLFGETGFKEMVQQSDDIGLYAQELAEKALLITVFDNSSALGRVKLFTKKAVEHIQKALSEGTSEPAPVLSFDDNWRDSTQALLDGLFGSEK
jgi:predicted regulator of Ras-like GTPase activity (Roadblock/LC7/MglB family)